MTEKIGIIGPRQTGKTLIAQAMAKAFITKGLRVAVIQDINQASYNKRAGNILYPLKNAEYDIIIYDGLVPKWEGPPNTDEYKMIYTTGPLAYVHYPWVETEK